jgi:hypothetical protein
LGATIHGAKAGLDLTVSVPDCPTMDRIIGSCDTGLAGAAIELHSRLWQEIEDVGVGVRAEDVTERRLLALRLELHLLLEACDSARWRALLTTSARSELRSVLERVLRAVESSDVVALMQAQNVLLAAVLALCERAGRELRYAATA